MTNAGEIVGFLGPNGAGKTTTMKIITSFMGPNEGDLKVGGISVLSNPAPKICLLLLTLAETGSSRTFNAPA